MKNGAITVEKKITGSFCKTENRRQTSTSDIGPDGCSTEDHHLASILKAIAHPVRIRILRLLLQSGNSLCSCEIEAHFSLRQPTISHHMKTLKDAGLVESWQEGSWVHYILSKTAPVPLPEILRKKRNR